jgi:hypothetical protein
LKSGGKICFGSAREKKSGFAQRRDDLGAQLARFRRSPPAPARCTWRVPTGARGHVAVHPRRRLEPGAQLRDLFGGEDPGNLQEHQLKA